MSNTTLLAPFPLFEAELSNAVINQEGFIPVPNAALTAEMAGYYRDLAKMFKVDFDKTETTFSLKVENKLVSRIYEPSIMADSEGQVIVAWGKESIPLSPKDFKVVVGLYAPLVVTPIKDDDWEYDNELGLPIVFNNSAVTEKYGSVKAMSAEVRKLSTMLKKGEFHQLLMVRGTSDFPVKAHTILEAGKCYKCIGYGSSPGEYQGRKFTTYHVELVLPGGEIKKVVAKYNVEQMLKANPVITPDAPAIVQVHSFEDAEYQGNTYTKVNWTIQLSPAQRIFKGQEIKELAAAIEIGLTED